MYEIYSDIINKRGVQIKERGVWKINKWETFIMDLRVIGVFSNAFFKSRFISSLLNMHINNVSQPALNPIPIIFLQFNALYYNAIEPECTDSIATSIFLTTYDVWRYSVSPLLCRPLLFPTPVLQTCHHLLPYIFSFIFYLTLIIICSSLINCNSLTS